MESNYDNLRKHGEYNICVKLDEALFTLEMLANPETVGRSMTEVIDWHSCHMEEETEPFDLFVPSLVGSLNFSLDCIVGAVLSEVFLVSGNLTEAIKKSVTYLDSEGLFYHTGTDMTRLAGLKIKPSLQRLNAFPFVKTSASSPILHLPFAADACLYVSVEDKFIKEISSLCGASGEVHLRSSSLIEPLAMQVKKQNFILDQHNIEFFVFSTETLCVSCSLMFAGVEPESFGMEIRESALVWV
jgi:hypothetical protein